MMSTLSPFSFLSGHFSPFHKRISSSAGEDFSQMLNIQKLQLTLVPVADQAGLIKVSGGTLDGIYVDNPDGATVGGADRLFTLLGQSDSGSLLYSFAKGDFGLGIHWKAYDFDGSSIYYSLSDVATPDLATNWLNASDDTPASIFVELATGSTREDCLVVSGMGAAVDGLYLKRGTSAGKDFYNLFGSQGYADADVGANACYYNGTNWSLLNAGGSGVADAEIGNETNPWEAVWTATGTATLTRPAVLPTSVIDVGQDVAVTDGFVVSGADGAGGDYREVNGFWYQTGVYNSKGQFSQPNNSNAACDWETTEGGTWFLQTSLSNFISHQDVQYPWQVTDWVDANGEPDAIAPILTHPAIQRLTAPSTAQGGVFVSGGAQDGIYRFDGTEEGKPFGNLLGQVTDTGNYAVIWQTALLDNPAWLIRDGGGGVIYYSTSDVSTPDLATSWKNYSDDSPASITVTSVTQGELDAGVTVAGAGTIAQNGVFLSSANELGRVKYILGDFAGLIAWDEFGWDNYYYRSDVDTAFPFDQEFVAVEGDPPAPTVTRNDVCSEANWDVIP